MPRLSAALAQRGLKVQIHAMGQAPRRDWQGVSLHLHPKFTIAERLWISRSLKRALSAEAKNSQILHNHGLWTFGNMYPPRAVRGTKCVLVCSPRGTLMPEALNYHRWSKRLMWTMGLSKVVKQASLLHATCEREFRTLREQGWRQPLALIPNGVDLVRPIAREAQEEKRVRRLVYLGRMHPHKGLDLVLQSWREVEEDFPAWQLIIAGPDERGYLKELKWLVRSLGLKRVSFRGPCYGQEKEQFFSSAELLVLASRSENFAMIVAEALAAGVPAVVTAGAPWEGLNENDCGWWVKRAQEELTGALFAAMTLSPEALRQKGERGRAWMQRDFSWERIAECFEQSYRWLLGEVEQPKCVHLN